VNKLTREEFIEKANQTHNNKYDYSLVDYKNSLTKVKIICPEHGVFEQMPGNHLYGQQCPKCARLCIKQKQLMTNDIFVNKAQLIHNYIYSYLLTEYSGSYKKIKIICPEHGVFEQTAHNHLTGQGCPKCKANDSKLLKSDTKEIFLNKVGLLNNKYDYSLVDYKNSSIKVKIICPKHGIFEQTPNNHITKKQGCPICKESKGEKEITLLLNKYGLKYKKQKIFKDCKNIRYLPFDFYIEKDICIEYDGKQHFTQNKHFGGLDKLKYIQNNDAIKTQYCRNNNIKLIRIKYNESIEDKLQKELWNKE
jgi:hypothetical protein